MKNTSRKPYIYKVTNLETGQYYIGSQCSGKTIGVNYFTSSTNKAFKDGFKTYGEEKYKIEIIKEFIDPDECVRAENYMIRDHMLLKDGLCLNRSYYCNNKRIFSTVGIHPSGETRKKMSVAHKGQSPWNKGRTSPNKGIHHSEETKQKISEALQGHHLSTETKQKISRAQKGHPGWNKGFHHSEETKQKICEAKKGIPSPRRIKISIENSTFDSFTEASKYYNVSTTTIRRWLKTCKHNSFYAI